MRLTAALLLATAVSCAGVLPAAAFPLCAVELATGRTTWTAARFWRTGQDTALLKAPEGAMRLPAGILPGLPRVR